jgi:hypothetical protein
MARWANIQEPLLGNGFSSKHVLAATDTNATMVHQQSNGVFYVVRAKMLQSGRFGATGYLQERVVRESVKGADDSNRQRNSTMDISY